MVSLRACGVVGAGLRQGLPVPVLGISWSRRQGGRAEEDKHGKYLQRAIELCVSHGVGGGCACVYSLWSLVGGVDGWRCVGVSVGPRGARISHLNQPEDHDDYSSKHGIVEGLSPVMTCLFYVHMFKLLEDVKMPANIRQESGNPKVVVRHSSLSEKIVLFILRGCDWG
jgi:hypothetical protein